MGTVELTGSPAVRRLYGRAALGLLPGRHRGGDRVPDTTLVLRAVAVERGQLAEFARVCGFPLADTLPPTYPHVLGFPLALQLITEPDFPLRAAGMVHLANRIEVRGPLPATARYDLAVRAENLRPHQRGRQVDLVTSATVDGVEVWRESSTYLQRERAGPASSPSPAAGDGPAGGGPAKPPVSSAVWRIGPEVGTAYAAVSGDRNPIHTSRLAARAFGFPRRIAHGMWSKARCLAQLDARLPDVYLVEVVFKLPVLLPSMVGFSATPGSAGAGWRFALHHTRSGKPHLSGALTPYPQDSLAL